MPDSKTNGLIPPPAPAMVDLFRVREPGDDEKGLMRLERNERLSPLPDWFIDRLRGLVDSQFLTIYPIADELYRKLAIQLGVNEDQLLLTAGSDAAFKALFHAYVRPTETVVMMEPSYAMYPVYTQMFQAHARKIAFDESLQIDTRSLIDAITLGVRLVMLANPNQPTGTLLDEGALIEIIERAGQVGSLVAIDEAYYPFSHTTALALTKRFDHLVVTRTFSKAGGLAGLRIGYATGHAEIIGNMFKVRSIHDVNSMAIQAALLHVENPQVITDYVEEVEAGGAWLSNQVRQLGLEPLPTHTNFMLIRVASRINPGELVASLRAKNCIVKGPFNIAGMTDCIRVTLGPVDLMKQFVELLKQSLGSA